MALPDYQILVLSPDTGDIITFMDSTYPVELMYSRMLNGIGTVALSIPGTDENYDLYVLDSFIEVYRRSPVTGDMQVEETYLLRTKRRYREENVERIVIGGVSLNHLLSRRVVDPEDDPLEAGGFSTKAGAADTVIRDYVREQAADLASASRQFPEFTVPVVSGTGNSLGARLRYENLLEQVQGFAKDGEVDFHISRATGRALSMSIGIIGSDLTKETNDTVAPWVGLDPNRGNLTLPSLVSDRKEERNFIYALGQGQGSTRIVLEVEGEGTEDSPYNRIEFSDDARTAEKGNALELLTQARIALEEEKAKTEFTFSPTGNEPGNIYRMDWDLGDKITILWGSAEENIRITGVEITVSAEGESVQTIVENIP